MTWPAETDIQRENREAIEAIREADPLAGVKRGGPLWLAGVYIYDDNLPEAWMQEVRLVALGPNWARIEWPAEYRRQQQTLGRDEVHPTRLSALRAKHAKMLGYLEQLRKACDEIAAEIEAEPEDKP